MENEALQLLNQSVSEIRQLRQENNLMAARLDMFDKMILLFDTQPNYRGQGMSEDLCWKIEKYTQSINKQ